MPIEHIESEESELKSRVPDDQARSTSVSSEGSADLIVKAANFKVINTDTDMYSGNQQSRESVITVGSANSNTRLTSGNKATNVFHFYELYFKAARWAGMLPLHFDPETYSVSIIRSGLPRLLCRLNIIYVTIYLIKQPLILYYSYSTNYKYETMKSGFMFQALWCFGYALISSTFLNQVLKLKTVSATITMWLKLERFIQVKMLPESVEKRKKRIKFLKIQFVIYIGAILGCFLTLTAMAFFIPRFPPFINSILLTGEDGKALRMNPNLPFKQKVLWIARKYAFACMESYTGIFAWTILGSFDVLISMMCRTICYAMDKLKELVILKDGLHEEELGLYHSLRVIVTNMNLAFGKLLFFQELFNMGTTVLVLYGALTTGDSIILTAFFFSNSIALTVRIYLLYLPMSTVYMKSLNFKKFIKSKLLEAKEERMLNGRAAAAASAGTHSANYPTSEFVNGSLGAVGDGHAIITPVDEKRLGKKVATFRYIVFRPWGFHKVSPTSILDYILAVMSYLVAVKKM